MVVCYLPQSSLRAASFLLLFVLYTNACQINYKNRYVSEYADDSYMVILPS